MQTPLVSFCFTTYKRHDYLKSTLESVRRQTFANFEVIVSDNDPEQSARVVVEGMNDPRFKYFPNEENLGMKKSFNKSLERSSGEFIVMIADDDPVYSDMLETLIGLSKRFPAYGMYMGGSDWFCTNPKVARLYNLKVGTNSFLSNELELNAVQEFSGSEFLIKFFTLQIFSSYLWSTCMVRRNVLIERGGVPDYGTPFLGDYAYLGLMGSHSGTVVINKSLGCQTIHSQNFGRAQNEQIAVAAKGFTQYLAERLTGMEYWPMAKPYVIRFVALWVVAHMAFLHRYFGNTDTDKASLKKAEEEVFQIDFMKRYKLKYYLKKNFPGIHNQLVTFKKRIQG
jgi:glycosyltransferase involved in cell wall biosynthesis